MRRRRLALSLLIVLALSVTAVGQAPVPAPLPKDPLAGWDEFVNKALVDWKVPGVAIAVVHGGEILLLKGYGWRDPEGTLPVTPKTLFPVGSATKAFTTFVMGQLAEEGKLDWNAPISRYIPGFRLKDPFASERINAVDLVTHRSGLPRHDALWFHATLSRAELVGRLRWLDPSKDFRTDFQYSNLTYVVAGLAVEKIVGTSWEEAVRARVFGPLGMTSSNFSIRDLWKSPDFALPTEERDGKLLRMEFRDVTIVGPALAINSSAADLVPWLTVQAGDGSLHGRRIVSEATLADLHRPRMETGAPRTEAEVVPGGYALGWFTDTYRGFQRLYHGASVDGFSAVVVLIPEKKLGMALLANRNGTLLPSLLARHLTDRLLGLAPREWNAERLAQRDPSREAGREAASRRAGVRRAGTKPAHPLEEYTGGYEDPGYGVLGIAKDGDRLSMTYNGITTPMEHWHDETWSGVKPVGADADDTFENFRITFLADGTGGVTAVAAPMEPAVADVVFRRRPGGVPAPGRTK